MRSRRETKRPEIVHPTAGHAPVQRAKWLAAVAVLGVAIIWGVSFAVVKATVGEVSPSRLVGWRFVLATLTLLTLRPRVLGDLDRQIVSCGIVLGALLHRFCALHHRYANDIGVDLGVRHRDNRRLRSPDRLDLATTPANN